MRIATELKGSIERFDLSDRYLYRIDDMVDQQTVDRVSRRLSSLKFPRIARYGHETEHARRFQVDVPEEIVEKEPLMATLRNTAAVLFPNESPQPFRAYVHCMVYGDSTVTHRDMDSDISIIYYLNGEWKKDWAGETIFFDDSGDARLAIAPRPGRVLVFQGRMMHRTGVPSRDCYLERLTLIYKFKSGLTPLEK